MQRQAKQQDRLRQELEEAARDLREAAERAQEDLPKTAGDAMRLCDAISQMGIPGDQDRDVARATFIKDDAVIGRLDPADPRATDQLVGCRRPRTELAGRPLRLGQPSADSTVLPRTGSGRGGR